MITTILFLCLLIVSISAIIYAYYWRGKSLQTIEINKDKQLKNEKIEQEIKIKEEQLKNIRITIDAQNDILQSLMETAEMARTSALEKANEFYETSLEELQSQLAAEKQRLKNEIHKQLIPLKEQIEKEQDKLSELQAKQLAYIQARQRQEEINSNQDYYRLVLDTIDINDVILLRELQPRFTKKESIDKLIWEAYYKPAYDILMPHLFTTNNKVCGIYQITDLTSGQSYIGQSVDIKERFRQHIKAALSYGKTTNKLYLAMQKAGPHNFTFEVLEEVSRDKLNEREAYWINFYKTKEFGLNSTKGNG